MFWSSISESYNVIVLIRLIPNTLNRDDKYAVIGVESKKSLNFFALECFLQKWQEKEDILCNIIMLKNNTLEYCDECGH